MPRYPGQQSRRWPLAVVAVVVAVGAGLWIGRVTAGDSAADASPNGPVCPGGRDDGGRRAAAVCLVQAYYALGRVSGRDAKLADLVMPGELDAARQAYKAPDAKVSTEYAAVAATKLSGSGDNANGQAWVAFVDSYRDGSPPLAQWWLASFGMHWQDGRWWLSGSVGQTVNATPKTGAQAQRTGFGPGWVAAGAT